MSTGQGWRLDWQSGGTKSSLDISNDVLETISQKKPDINRVVRINSGWNNSSGYYEV
jgi:hypothetical protein